MNSVMFIHRQFVPHKKYSKDIYLDKLFKIFIKLNTNSELTKETIFMSFELIK